MSQPLSSQQAEGAASLDRILDAAEQEFSESGFEGAGMKAIAAHAGVSQGLLHYHFGSKERLYEEVIRARSKKINDARRALLSRVEFTRETALPEVLAALFRPALGEEGGGKAYARIYAGLMVGRPHDQALVRECYDPTALQFIDAIMRARPDLGQARAGMVYQLALGVLASVISRDGRIERLMGREDAPLEEEALIAAITEFVAGGADAMSAPT
jgi:AcrR family transcriptional regulator